MEHQRRQIEFDNVRDVNVEQSKVLHEENAEKKIFFCFFFLLVKIYHWRNV